MKEKLNEINTISTNYLNQKSSIHKEYTKKEFFLSSIIFFIYAIIVIILLFLLAFSLSSNNIIFRFIGMISFCIFIPLFSHIVAKYIP